MSFDTRLLLFAVAVQAFLAFVLLLWMGLLRRRDLNAGLDPQSVALREQRWSQRTTQVAHAFSNQFELPLLFYVVAILFVTVVRADLLIVVLAWVFVLSRIVHAIVHTSSNIVLVRGAIYGVGFIAIAILWVYFIFLVATLPA